MRSKLIDSLKGIGALLVVIGHLVLPDSIMKIYIYSFHMPLFFILAGYVFNDKPNFIFKKIKSLIFPYFIFVTLSMIVNYDITRDMNVMEILNNYFYLNGYIIWNSSLWFLPVLFCTSIFYLFISKFKNYFKIISLIMIFTIGYIFSESNIVLPFGLHILPISLVFYSLGQKIKHNNIFGYLSKQKWVITIIVFIGSIYFSWKFGRTNMSTNIYNNYFLYFIIALFSLIPYIKIASVLKENKLIKLYGKYSLFMFCTQRMLFKVYNLFSNKVTILNNVVFLILITILIYSTIIYFYEKINLKKFL